jgi:hypothetical protein
MENLGVAVLGTAVLGTAVLGIAVLHSPNRWIGKGTRPRLRLHVRNQMMCLSPTPDATHLAAETEWVPAQMGASPAGDAGPCRRRCDGVGPGADARDGVPWRGRARSHRARSCRRAEIKHADAASSRNTQSEVSTHMRVIRSSGRSTSVLQAQMVHCSILR